MRTGDIGLGCAANTQPKRIFGVKVQLDLQKTNKNCPFKHRWAYASHLSLPGFSPFLSLHSAFQTLILFTHTRTHISHTDVTPLNHNTSKRPKPRLLCTATSEILHDLSTRRPAFCMPRSSVPSLKAVCRSLVLISLRLLWSERADADPILGRLADTMPFARTNALSIAALLRAHLYASASVSWLASNKLARVC